MNIKRKPFTESSKIQSMMDHDENSLDSTTGYKDTGNDATVHKKARMMRNNDNSSHM